MKLGNDYILCTDQKSLQKMFVKVWLALYVFKKTLVAKQRIKNGNNIYEH